MMTRTRDAAGPSLIIWVKSMIFYKPKRRKKVKEGTKATQRRQRKVKVPPPRLCVSLRIAGVHPRSLTAPPPPRRSRQQKYQGQHMHTRFKRA